MPSILITKDLEYRLLNELRDYRTDLIGSVFNEEQEAIICGYR